MRYKCPVCGYIFDEEKEGKTIDELGACPVCGLPASNFIPIDENGNEIKDTEPSKKEEKEETVETEKLISYPSEYDRSDSSIKYFDIIKQLAEKGEEILEPMATTLSMPNWDDILVMANQLNPQPLFEDEEVSTTTIIGKKAEKPLTIEHPVFISHMSFGALSKETKIALSKGSAKAKSAMCSGEGGVLPQVKEEAYKYILEYVPNKYSITDEMLKSVDAIEIKIGQGTKPGMGGLLPADKVTEDISKARGKPLGEDIVSPSKFEEIKNKEDLKNLVNQLRNKSEGRPIGIKIAPNKLEQDLEHISYANPDYITIDGRGGATGAGPKLVKDSTTIPTIYALYRTRKYLDEHDLDIDLVVTGGLRISSDFVKALAMGADAIAIASAALIAVGCQQYRACNIGNCPVGIATQDEQLRKKLDGEIASQRVYNYLKATLDEIKTFARITGHNNIHDLNIDDLATINSEISDYTNIKHV